MESTESLKGKSLLSVDLLDDQYFQLLVNFCKGEYHMVCAVQTRSDAIEEKLELEKEKQFLKNVTSLKPGKKVVLEEFSGSDKVISTSEVVASEIVDEQFELV